MKKSKAITLVLITSSLFAGCQDKMRNQYASWDDCRKDYPGSDTCAEETQKNSTGHTTRFFYGPWYRSSYVSNPAYNPSAVSKRSVGTVRGGFGSIGGHSSGS